MYPLQAPPAHQDQPQLGSGRPLVGINFQLSSAAAGPPSRPGQERCANWVAELSGGLVGANLGSPILCLPVSTTSSLRGSLHGQARWGDTRGRHRQLCIHELPGPGTSLSGSTYQLDKLRQVTKAPQPQFLSPGTGSQSIRLLGCRQHSVTLCLEPVPGSAAGEVLPRLMTALQLLHQRELLYPLPRGPWLSPHPPWCSQTPEAWQRDLIDQIPSQSSSSSSSSLPGRGCPRA